MLASLKLKPEVIISELIAECERQIPGQHIDPGDVEYAKHLSDRGALKIRDATSPEYHGVNLQAAAARGLTEIKDAE